VAGFTTPSRNLPVLQKTLIEIAESQLKGVDLRPRLDIDFEIALPELGGETYRLIQRLAPFGKGNPLPTFVSRAVEVASCRTMGNGQQHLRMRLRQHGTMWDGVAFRQGDSLSDVGDFLDIAYNLELDRWGGSENLRLNILSFLPSAG
jgi:single-stranded-DNA-specific exonuclease